MIIENDYIDALRGSSPAHISKKYHPNIIKKCGNDQESYDDRKCDNMTGRATGCLKKIAPNIGFWLFSPAGWFYMGRKDAV